MSSIHCLSSYCNTMSAYYNTGVDGASDDEDPSFLFTLRDTASIADFIRFFAQNVLADPNHIYECYLSKKPVGSSEQYEALPQLIINSNNACLDFVELFSDVVLKQRDTHIFRCVIVKKTPYVIIS